MLIPEPAPPLSFSLPAKKAMKITSVASALLAIAVVVLLARNTAAPSEILVQASQALAMASALSAAAAIYSGFWHIRSSRPDLRRPAMFLVMVTLGVLLSHLYVVNSPPTAQTVAVTGPVGRTFGDTHLQVSSSLSGSKLTVHVLNVGSGANGSLNAIGSVSLDVNGISLPGSNFNPAPSYDSPLQPASTASLGYPIDAAGVWTVNPASASSLTVSYQYLTCYHVPTADDQRGVFGCIMDESYYVPSALGLLSGEQCAPFADSCNLEHPPLAKALIAAGVAVFGLDDLGYRFSEILLGTLSIPLVYVLVEALSGERRLSYFATLVFAADPLFFVHSSAALIDVPAVFFSLLGFVVYLRPGRFLKVGSFVWAGLLFGLAALAKETALFALLAVLTYELLFGGAGFRSSLIRVAQMTVPAVVLIAAGLQLYDSLFTPAALPWFYQQVQFMLGYGIGLKSGGWCLGTSPCPNGPFITPLNWLTVYPPVSYLVVLVSSAGSTYVSVGYYGVANQAIVWMVYLWLPVALYPVLKEKRWRSSLGMERRLGAFLAVWLLWSYVPYVVLWAYGRVTYPFYMLPAVPALATGAAYFITRDWFPRRMAAIYVIAAFGIFVLYFPVKDFLPVPVRVLLGH